MIIVLYDEFGVFFVAVVLNHAQVDQEDLAFDLILTTELNLSIFRLGVVTALVLSKAS